MIVGGTKIDIKYNKNNRHISIGYISNSYIKYRTAIAIFAK